MAFNLQGAGEGAAAGSATGPWGAALGGVLGGLGGGGGDGPPGTAISSVDGRARISISPVGVNLGEILKPFTDSPFNGGRGLIVPSRISRHGRPSTRPAGSFTAGLQSIVAGDDNIASVILISLVIGVAVITIARRKR